MASWLIVSHTPTLLFCYTMGTIFFLQIIPPGNPLSFNYTSFQRGSVTLGGYAAIVPPGVIQITDQSKNASAGRVTSNIVMQLRDKSSRQLTDFTTTFSFVIHSADQRYCGDGMAFFLADPKLKDIHEGGGLGLVDGEQVSHSTDEHLFMAVEFDTFQNSWDPPGIHVGLNLNSMKSNVAKQWLANIAERRVYGCSTEYNSSTLNLSVAYTEYTDDQPPEYVSYKVDLREYLPKQVIAGFSAARGRFLEVHNLVSWSFSSSLQVH